MSILLTSDAEGKYGFYITHAGRNLIAKLVAGKQLVLSRVMVGSGQIALSDDPRGLLDLIAPVAAATSTEAIYDGDTVHSTIQYRSDMNGGLSNGFWLREYGIFAIDPDAGEIMIGYCTLYDHPQWVSAAGNGIDVRNFPYSIIIGEDAEVYLDYAPEAWMTAEDVSEYCTIVLLPLILEELAKLIAIHNVAEDSHPDIRRKLEDLYAEMGLLRLRYDTDVSGNPFVITFGTLDGLNATGVHNKPMARLEF